MAKLEIKGILVSKGETEQKTETFKVREFVVLVTDGEYSDYFKIQLSNDNCNRIDNIQINTEVEVKLNVKGRKYEKDGKTNFFTTLDAWYVKGLETQKDEDLPY